MISAQQYYVEYGPELVIDRLQSLLSAYIPDSFLQGQKAITFWIQVSHTLLLIMIMIMALVCTIVQYFDNSDINR